MKSKFLIPLIFVGMLVAGLVAIFVIPSEDRDYPYKLTIVTIFKDDAPWLKEMIEYYKLIGADHMLFYDNESSDHFKDIVAPYVAEGFVEVIPFRNRPHKNKPQAWVYETQCPAYNDAIKRLKGKSKWVAIVDTDEFIVPHKHNSLVEALKPYEGIGGIVVNWNCYGTSDVWDIPENKLMIETLTRRMSLNDPMNFYTKMIVEPEAVNRILNPHYAKMKKGKRLVHTDFSPLDHPISHSYSFITVNHYYTRTKKYLIEEKIKKKELMDNRQLSEREKKFYFETGNFEDDPERHIFRFIPQLKEKLLLK